MHISIPTITSLSRSLQCGDPNAKSVKAFGVDVLRVSMSDGFPALR